MALRAAIIGLCLLLSSPILSGTAAHAETAEVQASRIANFRIGSSETRFGPLEFVGGLSLSARARSFGSLSGFRFLTPGDEFIAVTDTGRWAFGRIERDGDGRPLAFADYRTEPIRDVSGEPISSKWEGDAEGLSIRDGIATVSFERAHRIEEFRIDTDGMGGPLRRVDFLVPPQELRRNAGFEAVAHAPREGLLEGARVAITERSLDPEGNIFAAILEGPRKGVFFVVRSDGFDITDAAFLPDGDLVLLERRFSVIRGVAMRLRRVAGDALRPGALVDGEVMLETGMSARIDNMEGIDIWTRHDGATMISLVSDDNQSLLQRSLYLEFRLAD